MEASVFTVAELRARPGRKWHKFDDDVLPAWIAEMDFGTAEPIQAVLGKIVEEASYGYEPDGLYSNLAAAFAGHMQDRFGWRVGTELVVPVADLVQALFTAVNAFTARGDGVVLQTPIYPPFVAAVRDTGRKVVENCLLDDGTRFVVDIGSLQETFGRAELLLLCNPHNPTGRSLERSELQAIAQAAVERNLIVVADEVHADLTYPGFRHIPFASLGPEIAERTVTLSSATKAFNIPGLRCGLMHFGSLQLRERFRTTVPDRMLGIVNRFGIEATIAAWRECAPWLQSVIDLLCSNRSRLADFMQTELPQIGHHSPEATYLAWLDCRRLNLPMPPQPFFLQRARVAMNDGADFLGEGRVRLNFATSPRILDEVLERIAAAVRAL